MRWLYACLYIFRSAICLLQFWRQSWAGHINYGADKSSSATSIDKRKIHRIDSCIWNLSTLTFLFEHADIHARTKYVKKLIEEHDYLHAEVSLHLSCVYGFSKNSRFRDKQQDLGRLLLIKNIAGSVPSRQLELTFQLKRLWWQPKVSVAARLEACSNFRQQTNLHNYFMV